MAEDHATALADSLVDGFDRLSPEVLEQIDQWVAASRESLERMIVLREAVARVLGVGRPTVAADSPELPAEPTAAPEPPARGDPAGKAPAGPGCPPAAGPTATLTIKELAALAMYRSDRPLRGCEIVARTGVHNGSLVAVLCQQRGKLFERLENPGLFPTWRLTAAGRTLAEGLAAKHPGLPADDRPR